MTNEKATELMKTQQWQNICDRVAALSEHDAAGVARYVSGYLRGNKLAAQAFEAALLGAAALNSPGGTIMRRMLEQSRPPHITAADLQQTIRETERKLKLVQP